MQLGNNALGFGLRPPVRMNGRHGIVLAVPAARSVEDDVTGQVNEANIARRGRYDGRAFRVDGPRVLDLPVGGVDDRVATLDRRTDGVRVANVDPNPVSLTMRRVQPPGRPNLPTKSRRKPDKLAAEVAATPGYYQPRRSRSSLGSSEAVEMPTIASPSPAETRARTSASM